MNKWIGMGRMTADPDIRYTQGGDPMCVASFNLAVDRRVARNAGEDRQTADFPRVIAFGKRGEFIEKFGRKGLKLVIEGRIQTGSYKNQNGDTVYTTDVVAENIEFAESKGAGDGQQRSSAPARSDGFMEVPDGLEDGLPFA